MPDPTENEILEIVSKYLKYNILSPTPEAIVLEIAVEDLPVPTFANLLADLKRVGYSAFTGGENSRLLYIIKKRSSARSLIDPHTLKLILAIATLATIIYAGYAYDMRLSTGQTNFFADLGAVLLLFVLPILVIMGSREFGRYMALKKDGISYSFPIVVPDPIIFGTMGSIMGHKEPYVTRGCMFRSGFYPLAFGFSFSVLFFIVGIVTGSPKTVVSASSPTTNLSLPLILSGILYSIEPQEVSLNLLAYAGWVGLIVNSFNAFPLGYLDGGLIVSSLLPSYSKYFNYGSLPVMAVISYFSPSWFILLVFAVILGIEGPKPLYALKGLGKRSRVIILASMLLIVGGMAPIPFHGSPSNFKLSLDQTSFLLINGTNENITLRVTVFNNGGSSILPEFTLSPQVPSPAMHASVTSSLDFIAPGADSAYNVTLQTWNIHRLGFFNYTLYAYSGTSYQQRQITILNVNNSGPVTFAGSSRYIKYAAPNIPFNISFSYSSNGARNLSVYFFAPDNFTYSIAVNNANFSFTGYAQLFGKSFQQPPNSPVTLSLEGSTDVNSWNVVVMTQDYQAAVTEIYLG